MSVAILQARRGILSERSINIGLFSVPTKTCGRDAHNRERLVVDHNLRADCSRTPSRAELRQAGLLLARTRALGQVLRPERKTSPVRSVAQKRTALPLWCSAWPR